MKIGILTSWGAHNYGAMLQAWALMTFLRREGHEPVFLDTVLGTKHVRPLWKTVLSFSKTNVRRDLQNRVDHAIASFSTSFPSTPPLHSWKKLREGTKSFDAVIVGSDQMWNPHWVLPYVPLVFLGFCPPGCRRISYAASFSVPMWPSEKRDEVAGLLRKFYAVGIREQSGANVIKGIAPDVHSQVVLDPTLLMDGKDYRPLYSESGDVEDAAGKVFSYFLPATSQNEANSWIQSVLTAFPPNTEVFAAEEPVRKLGLAPICRLFGISGKISVPNWLGRIATARFVITNSFHGTVFSILFRRPFASVLLHSSKAGRDMNERLLSLLPALGLESRLVCRGEEERMVGLVSSPIDWENVHEKLGSLRERSFSFLRASLAETTDPSCFKSVDSRVQFE